MPRIDDEDKRNRSERIYLLLTRNARGVTEAEIADEINIERRTVNNYLWELEFQGKAFKDGLYWFPLALKESRLRPFDLTPEEAVTLYLGARLLSKQQDKRNEPAETALLKLASVLKADAGVGDEIEQAARELAQRPTQKDYQPIFRDVVRGYIYRKKVEITYRPLNWNKSFQTTFSTYLLEPSPIGFTTYLIGHSSIVNKWRAYKLERIESVRLTREDYSIPPEFPGLEILRNAWSIVMGEETVRVLLRFRSETAKARVLETRWHPSQQTYPDPDDSNALILEFQVADTLDLIPWIRSWGADVEALEPDGLKEELKQTARDLSTQYRVSQVAESAPHHLFWAKADKKKDDFHRLHYHLIDVGHVALGLWEVGLNNKLRQEITEWLGLDNIDDAGRLIAFMASLHDLGKASPAFQDHPYMPQKLRGRIGRELQIAGFKFPSRTEGEPRVRHEVISTKALKDEGVFAKQSTMPPALAELFAQSLGGHHGMWPLSTILTRLGSIDMGKEEWITARQALYQELVEIFKPPVISNIQLETLKDNIMMTLISGIVSVADWIGSDDKNFPHEQNILPVESYVRHSRQHARYALLRTNWEKAPPMPQFDFEKVFTFPPREAQQQVSDALNGISLPALAIIEAPMGSGKTEAAMAVYAQWAKETGNSGLYVAMPTTATSNQMHTRIAQFLRKQLRKDIEPLLVHSQALLRDLPEETDAVEEDHGNYQATSEAWFLPRKKSLLAPFGVGTVDQALMSVLQTKHFFVRLLGLSHKVVIFDEVHAYDAYMSELFERLLIWLRQIGVSVIVLSATLPNKTRQRLIQAYACKTVMALASQYPCLTFACSDGQVEEIKLTPPAEKTLRFEWIKRDEESIIEKLEQELQNNGCAVVICNTVSRAQRLYGILRRREEKLCDDDNLILFHARFPMAWREELEHKVLRKFGPNDKDKTKPNPDRPTKAIVIATQVVEQSLDLDFDVMISDHAPMDLLLQRAGRLQRHDVNNPRKQPYLLYIAAAEIDDDLPIFERSDMFVYDEYVLLRSWIVLNNIAARQITLPTDLPVLIEQVYGAAEPTDEPKLLTTLAKAKEEMTKKQIESEDLAEERMVREPSFRKLLYQPNMQLEEDDERVHKAFRALTREGNPGLQVICLHRVGAKLSIEPDQPQANYDHSDKVSSSMLRELARHTINVRHPDPIVEQTLLTDLGDSQIKSILARWKRIAALRYHRVVIFEEGACRLPGTGYIMRLSKEDKLGLQIFKEVQ